VIVPVLLVAGGALAIVAEMRRIHARALLEPPTS
jgi:hypothetical protein